MINVNKIGSGTTTIKVTLTNLSDAQIILNKQITVGTPNGIGIDIGAGLYDNLEYPGNLIDFKVLYNTTYNNYSGYLYITASNATNLSWTWTEASNSTSPYWSWSPYNNGHTVAVLKKLPTNILV